MKPRKHAEIIHAWADGAKIEVKVKGLSPNDFEWLEYDMPNFYEDSEYRIKPQKKTLWGRYSKSLNWVSVVAYNTQEEAIANCTQDDQVFCFKVEV